MDELLDTREAARLLNVTQSAMRRWIREGRGPRYVRVSRLIRYRRSDLESWIESNVVQTGETVQHAMNNVAQTTTETAAGRSMDPKCHSEEGGLEPGPALPNLGPNH
jgi:excisionase family DNA binding protein